MTRVNKCLIQLDIQWQTQEYHTFVKGRSSLKQMINDLHDRTKLNELHDTNLSPDYNVPIGYLSCEKK